MIWMEYIEQYEVKCKLNISHRILPPDASRQSGVVPFVATAP